LNGGDDEVYLSSADWMTRNLDRRIELLFPVDDVDHKARVIAVLRAMFRDNVKARWLNVDGTYTARERSSDGKPFRVQQFLHEEAIRVASQTRERAGITLVPEERRDDDPRRSRMG
jgi:polyphosphate kinase